MVDVEAIGGGTTRGTRSLRTGRSSSVRLLRERLVVDSLAVATAASAGAVLMIVFFVVSRAVPLFRNDWPFFAIGTGWDRQIEQAWGDPTFWAIGARPLIYGSLLTTGGALLLSLLLGSGAAIFLSEVAPDVLRRPVESVFRMLAGVPSVVFGLVGLTAVVPLIQHWLIGDELALKFESVVPLDGQSVLAGVLVLTFMILPFFVTVATDALRALPGSIKLGGLALGMSHWRVITRLMLPAAAPGVLAGLVLAAARAIGEAVALSMVAGALAFEPSLAHGGVFLLEPVRTMASAIVETHEAIGDVPQVEAGLFALGTLLLFSSLLLSVVGRLVFAAFQKRMGLVSERSL